MRLGCDVRKLGDGGIGEYIRELLHALRRLDPALEIVAFGDAANRALLPAAVEWVDVRAAKYSLSELLAIPRAARGHRLDVFHSPHYVLPFGLPCPVVVTVHDLIHVRLPRTMVHPIYARWMMRSATRRAARVIAVSETTANDLRVLVGDRGDKVRVIPNGVSERFRRLPDDQIEAQLSPLGFRPGYVLFVGNWLPHKNVETLVRAWARVPEPRPALVLCGSGYETGSSVARVVAEVGGGDRVRVLGPVTSDLLVVLYNGAAIFASASLYEGFCLPIVEAFACGTAVLGPAAGAVPEVAGDAALLVSPDRVDSIADGMYRLLTEEGFRRELADKGLRRSARFSWETSARRTRAVYEEVRG